MSKRTIRYSLYPDHCRAIVPCEIVPGQTQPLLHETSCCGSTVTCWGERLPVLDAALHVFLTLPGHTSTREDERQPVVEGVMRLPVSQTGAPSQGRRKTCPHYTKKLQVAVYEDGHIAVNSRGHGCIICIRGHPKFLFKPWLRRAKTKF